MTFVIVDDHPLVRKGLISLMETCSDFAVIGEESTCQRACNAILSKKPDLALIDLKLRGEDGLNIVKHCKSRENACKFIIITSSPNYNDFQKALESGVDGYILKDALPEEVLYAVRIVAQGRKYYDPVMMDSVTGSKLDGLSMLTDREKEVLMSLGRGEKNSEIANKLYITEFTVKKYVSQILDKLSLNDRTQAALFAVNNGLVK